MATKKTTKKTKKVAKKATKKKTRRKTKPYFLSISINDVEFKTRANSLREALAEFTESDLYPLGAKTKLVIHCGKKDVERHFIYPTATARRTLKMIKVQSTAFELLANQLTKSIDG